MFETHVRLGALDKMEYWVAVGNNHERKPFAHIVKQHATGRFIHAFCNVDVAVNFNKVDGWPGEVPICPYCWKVVPQYDDLMEIVRMTG